jgi:hypothetical protein
MNFILCFCNSIIVLYVLHIYKSHLYLFTLLIIFFINDKFKDACSINNNMAYIYFIILVVMTQFHNVSININKNWILGIKN